MKIHKSNKKTPTDKSFQPNFRSREEYRHTAADTAEQREQQSETAEVAGGERDTEATGDCTPGRLDIQKY